MSEKAGSEEGAAAGRSISTRPGKRSFSDFFAGRSGEAGAFLEGLSPNALAALPWLFEHWAIPGHQLPPEGDWRVWVILGGRGAGKTRAGAEWVRAQVEGATPRDPGRCSRVALVGGTLDEAREVMVLGESGIIACSPPDRRPVWQATRRRLEWPNGASAQVFSASDPESLRGPQFDAAWCDEVAKWRRGREAWDMLRFGLRLGDGPRAVVTTSPRPSLFLEALLRAPGTAVTRAGTAANRANLAPGFVEELERDYGGSRLARQELEGEILRDHAGALWTWETIEAARGGAPVEPDRIVVAVDPPVTGGPEADECGIVVAGAATVGLEPRDWRAEVIEDASLKGVSPRAWAERAVEAFHRHGADRLVAEVNQGGDLVATVVRSVDPMIPFRPVRASRGKAARAEPVAALYEQGRVRHRARFPALEEQMAALTATGYARTGSPDRVDALVWAIHELMIAPAGDGPPRIRGL